MASKLYKCSVCGHIVAENAPRCVGCGTPGPRARHPNTWETTEPRDAIAAMLAAESGDNQAIHRADRELCSKCGQEVLSVAAFCPNCGDSRKAAVAGALERPAQSAISREPIIGFVAVALATASLISPYFAAVFFAPAAFICGVIALARGEKKWIGIAGLVLALVAFVGIFGVSQEITQVFSSGTLPRSALDAAPIVSKSKYDQIHEGMTYEQVKTIIGSPGEEVSRTDLSGTSTVIYSWSNSNGSNLIATFEDDRLASKAQFGLSE